MLTEHLAPLPWNMAKTVANHLTNEAQKKAKEDKKKKERRRWAHGEDTSDEEKEEGSREEWPATMGDEPDWYVLERED